MLQEKKVQTIFDEHFPQQILPSPVASRIKQQMQLQLSQQARPSAVQNSAEQRKKVNLLLAIEQWWNAFQPQLQPMPAFAMTGATALCLFLVYFLVQENLLSGIGILQRTDEIGAITAANPNDDTFTQTGTNREPEVLISYPTIDDMQIGNTLETVHSVAIAPTTTPMPMMPTPMPQRPEQIILVPTSRVVDIVYPVAMDHPPIDGATPDFSPTAQEELIDSSAPTPLSIAIAPTQPIEPLPTVPPIVPTSSQSQPPVAIALDNALGNALPTPMAQMPTPNPNLSQNDIVLRPTPTYYIAPTPTPTSTPTPTALSIAQVVMPTPPPTPTTISDRTVSDRPVGMLGVLGEGPSVSPSLAANSATATAQVYTALSFVNQAPTLLPPSEIVALPASPILPTATQVPPVQALPTQALPVQALPVQVLSVLPTVFVETPISVVSEATPWPSPTEIWLPSPTLLPTLTLISAVPATETPVWISPTPTPRPPEPTNTDVPPVQSHNDDSDNDDSDDDDDNKKDENKKRDENRSDPQPTATPIPPVVSVPVAPTAPPPPLLPTAPPPTPVPTPIQPKPEPVVPATAAALAPLATATSPPPPSSTPVPPTPIPPTAVPPTQSPPTQPPTQPPPTAKPALPVHTATPEPTKRLPTSTPMRVEIKPVVGVPEPTPRPTAIVQQPTPISAPIRESGLGAEPVTAKDSNPVKPVFTPISPPDRSRPTPIRVEINPQPSQKIVPTLTPRPTSKPIVLDGDAESDRLLGKDEASELESATE